MSVIVGGTEYMVGPSTVLGVVPFVWDDHCRVQFRNQSCVVFRNRETGQLRISWQPLNSQYRAWAPLATKSQLLQNWS